MKTIIERILKNANIELITDLNKSRILLHPTSKGCLAPAYINVGLRKDTIIVSPYYVSIDYSCPDFLAILFHEIGHATGLKHALARPVIADFWTYGENPRHRYIEELIAERTSQRLMHYFGLTNYKHPEFSRDYINTYMIAVDNEFDAYKIESDVDKAFEFITQVWMMPEIAKEVS